MGKYKPIESAPKGHSLQEALDLAEGDHFVDCPSADSFSRVMALVLDLVFLLFASTFIQKLTKALLIYFHMNDTLTALNISIPLITSIQIALEALLLYLYLILSVTNWGGTPAKLLLKLRVVDAHSGQNLGFFRTLLREILGKAIGVLVLGFLWPLFRQDKRAFHDLISNSAVKQVQREV